MTQAPEVARIVDEVRQALDARFGEGAAEYNPDHETFSVFYGTSGCFVLRLLAVGGGDDMLSPEHVDRIVARVEAHAAEVRARIEAREDGG